MWRSCTWGMNSASRLRSHRSVVSAAIVAASLAAMLTSCSASGSGGSASSLPAAGIATAAVRSPAPEDSVSVVLRVGNGRATATLDDTPVAREFAAMLPLRLNLHDPMGQSKSGQLPRRIDVSDDDRVFDPSAGEVYYWPPSGAVGIFYDDLGQSVPPPGMVRLGVLDSGVDEIASAGNRFTFWINSG
jgi:hypothetical protein